MKKLSVFLSAVLILASLFQTVTLAVELDDYEVSEPYKTSIFYKTVTDLPLTGDQRYDVVQVALTQVGYHEGDSDEDMHGTSKGERNFVEYNRLYGKLDNGEGNGHSYGYMWCASFVSWVLRTANVEKKIAGQEVSCASWVNFFENKGQFKTRQSGYTPVAGDIIFYKGSRTSSRSNHVGIVVGCKDGVVYTVEGNTSGIATDGDPTNGGGVARKNYSLADTYIVGYGVPRYETKPDTVYDFELFEISAMTPGKYTVVSRNAKIVEAPGASETLLRLAVGTTFDVSNVNGGYGECTVDGVSGWVNLSNAMKTENAVHTVCYVTGNDEKIEDQEKDYGKSMELSETVPAKKGFEFKGWAVREGGAVIYAPGDNYPYDLDVTLHAVWEQTAEVFTVVFKNDDGTVISEKTYLSGETVEVPKFTKEDENGKKYTLSWSSEIENTVTKDAVYTAVFTPAEAEDEGGSSTALIITLIAVAAVAVVAVIFAIKTPSKKKDTAKETTNV